jgi:hypothetical protein
MKQNSDKTELRIIQTIEPESLNEYNHIFHI